jgi:hypothetical protein
MPMPNLSRRDTANRVGGGEAKVEKPTQPDVAVRLSELIRQEDEKLSTTDPGQVLRRRACPPGE